MISNHVVCIYQNELAEIKTRMENRITVNASLAPQEAGVISRQRILQALCLHREATFTIQTVICKERLIYNKLC